MTMTTDDDDDDDANDEGVDVISNDSVKNSFQT